MPSRVRPAAWRPETPKGARWVGDNFVKCLRDDSGTKTYSSDATLRNWTGTRPERMPVPLPSEAGERGGRVRIGWVRVLQMSAGMTIALISFVGVMVAVELSAPMSTVSFPTSTTATVTTPLRPTTTPTMAPTSQTPSKMIPASPSWDPLRVGDCVRVLNYETRPELNEQSCENRPGPIWRVLAIGDGSKDPCVAAPRTTDTYVSAGYVVCLEKIAE